MILKYHVIKKTFFYTLLYCLCIVNAQSNRLFWDGRDWNRVSKTVDYNTENTIRVKKAYLDGVLDGRLYGYLRTWAVDKKIADEVFSETVDYLNTRELIKSIDNFYEDPINGYTYRKLLPYGRLRSRENAIAPDSMSLERHRLIWLYLKEKTNFFSDNLKFLHIAPEYCFIKLFKNQKNLDYTTADLNSPWADVKMDVHDIPFEDNSFDVIMCNHVLEHVQDDRKVMKEFYRVIKKGGWGIFQVPIDTNRKETFDDPSITDPKQREKHYWQDDHVRLYGLDYGNILSEAGFEVIEDDYIYKLDPKLVERYALPKGEIIYFCKKTA